MGKDSIYNHFLISILGISKAAKRIEAEQHLDYYRELPRHGIQNMSTWSKSKQPRARYKYDTNSRKTPEQVRARLRHENILSCAMKILNSKGYQGLSTTKIAKELGISVGSIYEYFPNKDAIIYALFETTAIRAANDLRNSIYQDILQNDADFDYEHGTYQSIERCLSIYEEHGDILITLIDQVPALKEISRTLSLENISHNASRMFMESRACEENSNDIDPILFVATSTFFNAIRNYVSTKEKPCTREHFIKELTGLLIAYYINKRIIHKSDFSPLKVLNSKIATQPDRFE